MMRLRGRGAPRAATITVAALLTVGVLPAGAAPTPTSTDRGCPPGTATAQPVLVEEADGDLPSPSGSHVARKTIVEGSSERLEVTDTLGEVLADRSVGDGEPSTSERITVIGWCDEILLAREESSYWIIGMGPTEQHRTVLIDLGGSEPVESEVSASIIRWTSDGKSVAILTRTYNWNTSLILGEATDAHGLPGAATVRKDFLVYAPLPSLLAWSPDGSRVLTDVGGVARIVELDGATTELDGVPQGWVTDDRVQVLRSCGDVVLDLQGVPRVTDGTGGDLRNWWDEECAAEHPHPDGVPTTVTLTERSWIDADAPGEVEVQVTADEGLPPRIGARPRRRRAARHRRRRPRPGHGRAAVLDDGRLARGHRPLRRRLGARHRDR